MQESIKLARSKAKNPDQENIRQLKQDWNADTSEFVHSLIQFKKLMNGRESDFHKQKSKITDPIPVEPSVVIQSLAQKFKELAEQAYTIGNKQKEYSGNRLARRKEASNKITRLLSYIKGPHFGTSPEATLNRSRKSLLSLAADVSKDFKILNSKILGRNHGSLLEAGAVFKRLRETLSAFVTFLSNLENPTKALPEPKDDEKKSRKINYMHHYLDYFAGQGKALDKIKTELKTVLNAIKIDGKEHLLPLIFNNIEEIEKIGDNIERSEDEENKAKLAEYLFEKIQALKETLKTLFPENITPPRKDNTIKAFVDAFKAKDFPKKDGHILGRPRRSATAPNAPPNAPAPASVPDPDPDPVPTGDASASSLQQESKAKTKAEEKAEAKAKAKEEAEAEAKAKEKLNKFNELIEFKNSINSTFISFINFCKDRINEKNSTPEINININEIKKNVGSNVLNEVLSGMYNILKLYTSNVKTSADSPTTNLFNLFDDNYQNIINNKISNEKLDESQINNIRSLFEKIKNEISSGKISNALNKYELSAVKKNYFYFKTINDSLQGLDNSKFEVKLKEVIGEINVSLVNKKINFILITPLDVINGLEGFKNYIESEAEVDRAKIINAKKKEISACVINVIKENAKDLLEAAVQDFKTLNQIPKDANPKLASDLIYIRAESATKAISSTTITRTTSNNNRQLISTGQNKAFDWAKRKLHEISFWNKTSPLRLKISDFAVKAKKATDELMDDLEHRVSFELLEKYKDAIVDLFSRIESLMRSLLAGSEARSANIDDLLETRYLGGVELTEKQTKELAEKREKRRINELNKAL